MPVPKRASEAGSGVSETVEVDAENEVVSPIGSPGVYCEVKTKVAGVAV